MITRWLWILLGVAAWLFVRRLLRRRPADGTAAGGPGGGAPGAPPSSREEMVRDRVCNTFLPRSRAIVHVEDGREHFFCSETCRGAFLSKKPA